MPHESVTRAEREMSMGWAKANPALFIQSVEDFKNDYPITDWRHYVDLSRNHHMKLIAVRRAEPFASVEDYVMARGYLTETGYDL